MVGIRDDTQDAVTKGKFDPFWVGELKQDVFDCLPWKQGAAIQRYVYKGRTIGLEACGICQCNGSGLDVCDDEPDRCRNRLSGTVGECRLPIIGICAPVEFKVAVFDLDLGVNGNRAGRECSPRWGKEQANPCHAYDYRQHPLQKDTVFSLMLLDSQSRTLILSGRAIVILGKI